MLDLADEAVAPNIPDAPPESPPESPLAMPQQGIAGVRAPPGPERDGRWRFAALLGPALAVTALEKLVIEKQLTLSGKLSSPQTPAPEAA